MTIEAKVGENKIRIINAYGPQESQENNNKEVLDFWQQMEGEIVSAFDNSCFIVIEMDANAKVGNKIIKNDPHDVTNNGKLLLDLVEHQNLIIFNALDMCSGVITRERIFEKKIERSVIDYIIICEGMYEFLLEMMIDENRVHVLSQYGSKQNQKTIKSDHNWLFSKFSIIFNRQNRKMRREIFHFKCEEGKNKFLEDTSTTTTLSNCFTNQQHFPLNQTISLKTSTKSFTNASKR